MGHLENLRQAVVDGRKAQALAQVTAGLEAGIPAQTLLQEGLISAMQEVGALYESGEIFVPEMLVSARAMDTALSVLGPRLAGQGAPSRGKVVIGTVEGDLHDIGKNLVGIMLKGSGYEVVDLGVDVPAGRFVEAVQDGVAVVAMSALLTTTMAYMQPTIEAMRQAGVREKVRIIVGGAPITQTFADEIGADGYASDASAVVRLVETVLSA